MDDPELDARLARRREEPRCPIAQLMEWLERDELPPLAWVTRWSEGEREPLAAAWAAARDVSAMADLAIWTGVADTVDIRTSHRAMCTRAGAWTFAPMVYLTIKLANGVEINSDDGDAIGWLRVACAPLPTLADVLAPRATVPA